jgi:hypothetical protein
MMSQWKEWSLRSMVAAEQWRSWSKRSLRKTLGWAVMWALGALAVAALIQGLGALTIYVFEGERGGWRVSALTVAPGDAPKWSELEGSWTAPTIKSAAERALGTGMPAVALLEKKEMASLRTLAPSPADLEEARELRDARLLARLLKEGAGWEEAATALRSRERPAREPTLDEWGAARASSAVAARVSGWELFVSALPGDRSPMDRAIYDWRGYDVIWMGVGALLLLVALGMLFFMLSMPVVEKIQAWHRKLRVAVDERRGELESQWEHKALRKTSKPPQKKQAVSRL